MKKALRWVAVVLIIALVVVVAIAMFGRDTFEFGTIFGGLTNNNKEEENLSGEEENNEEETQDGKYDSGDAYPDWGSIIYQ